MLEPGSSSSMPYSGQRAPSQMARLSKAPIVACLTCPLCGNLFREATTISECLHTFCKECIYEMFNDEDINSCPICNVSLGCAPLEKLKPDPQLDDVQGKIFRLTPMKAVSSERGKGASPHALQHPTLPVRRKERSLSSLGVVTLPSSSRSRRTRSRAWVEEVVVSADEEAEEQVADGEEPVYWSEALDSDKAERTAMDAEPVPKRMKREPRNKSKQLDSDFLSPLSSLGQMEEKAFEEEAMKSLRATKNVRRATPQLKANGPRSVQASGRPAASSGIWFILSPASNQPAGEESCTLPEIKTPYLRIRDGKLPVSYVKKYVAKKLDLKSETEVEITCLGQPVVSSLPLESVRKIWLAKDPVAAQQTLHAESVGKEFLMVLTYKKNSKRCGITTTAS